MCGIAGIVGPGAAAFEPRVREMVARLRHRGPDDVGLATYDDAVLGAARLSIIDVDGGHQPFLDVDRDIALVCNGEIYGHGRVAAANPDYPFRSRSDVEVILALHRHHGDDLLTHLPGTFSFALWDDRNRSLLLARDRFGERPLYWCASNGMVAFASEIDSLRASGFVGRDLNREALAHMLRQGYVPPGTSIWRGVESLGPAARLRWTTTGPPRVDRWWEPPAVGPDPGREEAANWFRAELTRSVDEQLESDVPIGAFLSGGVDSSAVATLAARRRPGLDVFAFDMPGSSEVGFAREVATAGDMKLRVYTPDLGGDELADALVAMAGVWDEPFGDSSALPTWLLSRFAREYVTVALTGDGADELLGGYLTWARGCLDPSDPARPDRVAPPPPRLRDRWRRPDRRPGETVAARYARFRQYFSAGDLEALGLPRIDLGPVDLDRYTEGTADDISRFDLDHYLPGDILVKTDRASMAHGLEVRSPFLDVGVAEGCLRLPAHRKVDAGAEKVPLRDAFVDQLPASVLGRSKQGFGAPLETWLADPGVAHLAASLLRDPRSSFFDIVEFDGVQPHLDAPDQATWNLLTAALWWQRHGADGGA